MFYNNFLNNLSVKILEAILNFFSRKSFDLISLN